jgi:hypothetical protein
LSKSGGRVRDDPAFFGMAVWVFCGDLACFLAGIELIGNFTSATTAVIIAEKYAIFIMEKPNSLKEVA